MSSSVVPVLIGQLMVQSGIIDAALLHSALEKARDKNIQVGQILLYSGLIREHQLKAVLTALKMIRRSLITYEQAINALELVSQERYPYQAAFAKARWLHMREQEHEVGKLLLDAEIIGLEDLGWALATSIDNEQTFGRSLSQGLKIEPRIRVAAVEAIILARSNEITYKHAVAAMRASLRTGLSIKELIGLKESPLRAIGKEFILSGKLKPAEVADVVEETLQTETLWKNPLCYPSLINCLKLLVGLVVDTMEAEKVSLAKARETSEDLLLSTDSILREIESGAPESQHIRALLAGSTAAQIIFAAQNAARPKKALKLPEPELTDFTPPTMIPNMVI